MFLIILKYFVGETIILCFVMVCCVLCEFAINQNVFQIQYSPKIHAY